MFIGEHYGKQLLFNLSEGSHKAGIEWMWGPPQQDALDKLNKAVSSTPILRYYNLQEEVTLRCDASQSGLGAALLQNGQPVAYASRALTHTETRYLSGLVMSDKCGKNLPEVLCQAQQALDCCYIFRGWHLQYHRGLPPLPHDQ